MAGDLHVWKTSDLIAGGHLVIGDGYRAKNEELSTEGLPFARAGNIDAGFNFRDADRYPKENISRVGNKVSCLGDVVFTSKGTVGRFGFVSDSIEKFVYSPQLCFWRSLDEQLIDPRFLYYWMHGPEFHTQVREVASQTDMAEYVSLSDQRRMHITLPNRSTQLAIAHLLGSLDDKIDLNRRTAQTLQDMARALYLSWFVDFDPVRAKSLGHPTGLPNHLDTLFPNTFAADGLPDGWEAKPLSKIGKFLNGLALQKFPSRPGAPSLPVIKIAELRAGPTAKSNYASAELPASHVIEDGDHLFSWSGSLIHCRWAHGRGALNQHLFKVTPIEVPSWLTFEAVEYHLPAFQAIAASKAVTMGHIQRHHLDEALVSVPPKALLRAIDQVMAPLHERAFSLAIESRTLISMRDSLLPRLISGELPIGVPSAAKRAGAR